MSPVQDSHRLYSIHDIVTVKANIDVPIPDRFEVDDIEGTPDLTVTCGPVSAPLSRDEMTRCNIFFFGRTEDAFVVDYMLPFFDTKLVLENLDGETEIHLTETFKRFGDMINLFNTVLLFKLIQSGHTFVHSGCVDVEGSCSLIAGMRDTGKTSTVLSLVDGNRWEFMSDDLTIIGEDGSAYNYPTEVGISPYTLTGETVSYTGGRLKRWIASRQWLSLAVQDVIGYELSERKRVPESAIVDRSNIENVFILGGSGDEGATDIDTERATRRLLMTTTELIDPFRIYSLNYYSFYKDFDVPELFEREQEIIESAIAGTEVHELRANDIEHYADYVREVIGDD
jgi:hypothetical protein